jgi:hypothetical protein
MLVQLSSHLAGKSAYFSQGLDHLCKLEIVEGNWGENATHHGHQGRVHAARSRCFHCRLTR